MPRSPLSILSARAGRSPGVEPPPAFRGEAQRVATRFGDLWMRADDKVMLPVIKATGEWEREEAGLLESLASPGCRFLDVGANVGYFSALLGRTVPGIDVVAVEPEPENLDLLRLNLWAHAPAAEVWGCALSAGDRLVGLTSAIGNPGDTRSDVEGERAGMLAPAMTADDLLGGRPVDLVKIDVQGFELDVLQGMVRTIARSPGIAIVVEFLPEAIVTRRLDPLVVLGAYRTLGLDIRAQIGGRIQEPTDTELVRTCLDAGPDGFVNLVLRRRT